MRVSYKRTILGPFLPASLQLHATAGAGIGVGPDRKPVSSRRTMNRKASPDRGLPLMSIVGQFSRNLVAPGATVVVHINGVFPKLAGAFGSTPSTKSSTKSRLVTAPPKHALYKGISARGIDAALTLTPCLISCFARISWFIWVE
jgi:hypothetical protein